MHTRPHHRWTDISIRATGGIGLGLFYLCARELHARGGSDGDVRMLLLACLAVLLASAGGAMLALGSHLLDEVEISSRWARQPGHRDHAARPD